MQRANTGSFWDMGGSLLLITLIFMLPANGGGTSSRRGRPNSPPSAVHHTPLCGHRNDLVSTLRGGDASMGLGDILDGVDSSSNQDG